MTTATLTREAILAMEAGPEMDAMVAERVMGWEPYGPGCINGVWWRTPDMRELATKKMPGWGKPHFSPSVNIAHAWEVVDRLNDHFMSAVSLCHEHWCYRSAWWCEVTTRSGDALDWQRSSVVGETAPLAICRAALLATLEAA